MKASAAMLVNTILAIAACVSLCLKERNPKYSCLRLGPEGNSPLAVNAKAQTLDSLCWLLCAQVSCLCVVVPDANTKALPSVLRKLETLRLPRWAAHRQEIRDKNLSIPCLPWFHS